jgi:SAM-dependent methyltransferase
MERNRALFAANYCRGRGIEIGALHHPLRLPPEAAVRYVDRMSTEDLRLHYAELAGQDLVRVDVIDNGETLSTLPDGTEDFVVACQFIEHCENPVRALVNMLRVVKNRGFVLLTVPDKRFTFDKDRPITTNDHIMDECLHGCRATAREHYREYVRLVDKAEERDVEARVDRYIDTQSSIHYHVWDSDAFLKFLLFFKERLALPCEIFATTQNGNELMVALQKRVDGGGITWAAA